jgi:excisionase family DNA binding protein
MTNAHILVSRYIAADTLGISFVTLDRLTKQGEIRATKIGRRVLFAQTDLQKFADKARKESR